MEEMNALEIALNEKGYDVKQNNLNYRFLCVLTLPIK